MLLLFHLYAHVIRRILSTVRKKFAMHTCNTVTIRKIGEEKKKSSWRKEGNHVYTGRLKHHTRRSAAYVSHLDDWSCGHILCICIPHSLV